MCDSESEQRFSEERGGKAVFLSAMRGEHTENGENSTNSVSAEPDETLLTRQVAVFVWEWLTVTLTCRAGAKIPSENTQL